MKSWLRLTLVTMTVGVDLLASRRRFTSLLASSEGILASTLRIVFLALYVYITASGLMVVHNPQKIRPLAVALALQVSSISSPFFLYKLSAGPALIAGFGSPTRVGAFFTFDWQLLLASSWRFAILQGDRWQLSVNLLALVFLILLLRSHRQGSPVIPEPDRLSSVIDSESGEAGDPQEGQPQRAQRSTGTAGRQDLNSLPR